MTIVTVNLVLAQPTNAILDSLSAAELDIVTPLPMPCDPYFDDVTLLIQVSDADQLNHNQNVDLKDNPVLVVGRPLVVADHTLYPNLKSINIKDGGYRFTNSAFTPAPGVSFTFELFVFPTSNNYPGNENLAFFGNEQFGRVSMQIAEDGYLSCNYYGDSTAPRLGPLLVNQWNYIRLTRDAANTVRIYLIYPDGYTQVSPLSYNQPQITNFGNTGNLEIGVSPGNNVSTSGVDTYVQQVRFTNGVVRDLSLPTEAFPTAACTNA